MNPRVRAWLLILLVAIISTAVTGGVIWYRSRTLTTAQLLKRMPTIDALVVYIDFEKLRQAGLVQMLSGSKEEEEPEYQEFVRKTDFHWSDDLDSALLAVAPSGKFIAARGRFDWKSLRSFVDSEGGGCYNAMCQLHGSTPERRISFMPLQSNLMGMAISDNKDAVEQLGLYHSGPDPKVPDAPIWLTIPASILKSQDLPAGTVSFARSVANADQVTLMLVPENRRLAAKMVVLCRNEEDAARIAADLTKTTDVLRSMISHSHATPNPADIASVLSAGSFQASGRKVFGYWPIDPAFIESMLGGR